MPGVTVKTLVCACPSNAVDTALPRVQLASPCAMITESVKTKVPPVTSPTSGIVTVAV